MTPPAAGRLAENPVLQAALTGAERVHLIGLVSDGGVHSGFLHLEALIRLGVQLGVPDLVLHAFTDGRDTLPTSGAGYLEARGTSGSRVPAAPAWKNMRGPCAALRR